MSLEQRPLARLVPVQVDPVTGLPGPTLRYVCIPGAVAVSDEPITDVLKSLDLSIGSTSLAAAPSLSAAAAPPVAAASPVPAVLSTPPNAPMAAASPVPAAMSTPPQPPTAARVSVGASPRARTCAPTAEGLSRACTPLAPRPATSAAAPPSSGSPPAAASSNAHWSICAKGSPLTQPVSSRRRGEGLSTPTKSASPSRHTPPGSPTTPQPSTTSGPPSTPSIEDGIDPSASAILRSIAILGIELVRSARPPRRCNKVFIVLEYGDGSLDDPFDGRVIDCTTDSNSAEFEASFKEVWWTKRRPFLSAPKQQALAPRVMGAGAAGDGPVSGKAACPPFALRPISVLLSVKNSPMGKRIIPAGIMDKALYSLGLSSTTQLTAIRVRRIFQNLSLRVNELSGGRARWTWSQTWPLELLMNDWMETDGSGEVVKAACLYPPWHASSKIKLVVRRLALVLAASLSDFWMFFLCEEFAVEWKPGFAFQAHPDGIAPLRKKRPADAVKNVGNKKAKAATKQADVLLHPFWRPAQDRSSLVDEVAKAEGTTLAQVHLLQLLPAIALVDPSTTEHLTVTVQERTRVERVNLDLGILLPMTIVKMMLEYYPGAVGDDPSTPISLSALELRCSSIPTARFTQRALMVMLEGHRLNDDIVLAQATFSWLDQLSRSSQQFPFGLGSVLSLAASVAAIAGQVREWLGASRAGINGWRFFDVEAGSSGDVAGCRAYGGHTTTYRELARGCQPTWMTSDVINLVLIELRVETRALQCYVLLSSEAASMLRVGNEAVTVAEAQKAANEIAAEAGDCDVVALVINLLNVHWISAVVDITNRCITVYDSLVGIQPDEKALAVERVIMLCDAVAVRRSAASRNVPQPSDVPWRVLERSAPVQRDAHSCGVFAVAHVIAALNGASLPLDVTGDVLRLALLHNVLSRGRVYEQARSTASVVTRSD